MRIRSLARGLSAALLAGALLAACSHDDGNPGSGASATGKTPAALLEEANTAIGSDDWNGALAVIDAAIAHPKLTPEERALAWQDKVVCEGHVNGDAGAIAALEQALEAKVEWNAAQYFKLGNDLNEAERLHAALAVVEAGTKKFEGEKTAKKLLSKLAAQLAKNLQAAGDTESLNKLSSLGYLGSSSGEEDEQDK
jgi:hypothetical protein